VPDRGGYPQPDSQQCPEQDQGDKNCFESFFLFHVYSPHLDGGFSAASSLFF
jgi:hypothetical protein